MKSIIKSMLVVFLVFSISVNVFGEINTNADTWAVSSMEKAYTMGILPESLLERAREPITRKEFCAIAVRFYENVMETKAVPKTPSPFSDETSAEAAFAFEEGIISGVGPTKFQPGGSLTREQMAVIIVRTLKACHIDLSNVSTRNVFSDFSYFSSAGLEAANQLYNAKIMSGYQEKFHPQKSVAVQEAVTAFVNAYERFAGKDKIEKLSKVSASEVIFFDGKKITIGESIEELEKNWGKPNRIDKNTFDLDRYVYLGNYKNLFMVSVRDGKVVEFFTNSEKFSYQGVYGTGTLKDIKNIHYLDKKRNRAEWKDDKVYAAFLLDNESNIAGILVQAKDWSNGLRKRYDEKFHSSVSLEVFDMVNALRIKNGKAPLVVDSMAAKVAENHSHDMSKNSYVGYNNKDGKTPFERMSEGGIQFSMAAENVAKSDDDAVSIYHEWISTIGTKTNLLNGTLTHGGIGIYIENYTLYVTADFYCP